MGTATKKTAKDSKKKQVKAKDLNAKKNVKGGVAKISTGRLITR